jgi:cysteine desulfurase
LATGLCENVATVLYLDHAATTMVRPEVREAMAPFLDEAFGNPSGIHGVSRRAKNAVEETRERVAELLGARRPLEIVFTGGGTEADNLAVAGAALAGVGGGGVVTTAVEHDAVLATTRFVERLGSKVTIVGVDRHGVVDPAEVAAAVAADTAVVSVMAANNETGVIQPVAAVAEALATAGREVPLHTDAVQSFISEEVTVESTRADMISLAAHKLGGPKGVGLLYVRDGIELEAVLHGGGQELGRRSGTHNVAGIVGLGAAMEAAAQDRAAFRMRVGTARDSFLERLRSAVPDLEVTGSGAHRLVQHLHVRFPGVAAETLLIRLDQAGVGAAAGSACHSGAVVVSHVLAAMGMDEQAASECVRFSFGWTSTAGDGDLAADLVIPVIEALR